MRLSERVPVLARPRLGGTGPGEHTYDTQVGLARPVVLAGLGLDERRFVESLEGGREVTEAESKRFGAVLAALAAAGALEAPDVPTAAPVVVVGMSDLAHAIEHACRAAGIATRAVRRTDDVAFDTVTTVVLPFVGAPESRLARRLMLDGVPHVLVACDEAGAWVSHIVVPGTTACARCRDVRLTAADPAWPHLASQLSGSPLAARLPRPPDLAMPSAAVRVAARLAAWFTAGACGVGESVRPDGTVAVAELVAEPACGCGAASGTDGAVRSP